MSATRTARPRDAESRHEQLTVAVTGATGTVGPALLARLARAEGGGAIRVLGRRRPESLPAKTEFRRADVRGTLAIARAALAAGARRFIHLSSAAVYGVRADNPEAADTRASARHFYARHKAQSELLIDRTCAGTATDGYVLRPCAIRGPHAVGAPLARVPGGVRAAFGGRRRRLARVGLRPALPAPPVPLQFVHEEDVAQAIGLAVLGAGAPGVYNLAGDGVVGGEEALARLGLRSLPVPRVFVEGALRAAAAAPLVVPAVAWGEMFTERLLTDSTKARRELGWEPRFSSRATLDATRHAVGW